MSGDTVRYPPGIAYVGGEYKPISEAKISVLDWGFLRSDATYDVVHVWKNRFFRLDKHIERFLASIDKLRMTLPVGLGELEEILGQCVLRAGLEDAYVEMVLTRGVSPTFSRDPRDAVPTFLAFAIPFGWIADEDQRTRGLDLHVATIERIGARSVDPTVKNYHWLDLVAGLFQAYDAGRETVVLIDDAGRISEGPGFNLFAVTDGAVLTPESGVLEGITRMTVLELCRELAIPAATGPLTVEALKAADEVFITSTAGGVMAVGRIDGEPVGSAGPGPLTQRIIELYWAKYSDPDWSRDVAEVAGANQSLTAPG